MSGCCFVTFELFLLKISKMKNSIVFLVLLAINFCLGQSKFNQKESEKFQKTINSEYADAKTSPLMAEDLKTFKSLDFYAIDQKYCVEAIFIRTKREKAFEMKTTTDRKPLYRKYGELHFTLDGKAFKLNVYENHTNYIINFTFWPVNINDGSNPNSSKFVFRMHCIFLCGNRRNEKYK